MKTAFYKTAFLLLALGFVPAVLTAAGHEENDPKRKDQLIRIEKERKDIQPIRPRMPARVAIECMYEAASESLSFGFFDQMGGVAITVMNAATGEIVCDYCPSTPGSWRTALSGDAGTYRIELEDDGGSRYTGEFEL